MACQRVVEDGKLKGARRAKAATFIAAAINERPISMEEIVESHSSGRLQECFRNVDLRIHHPTHWRTSST